VSDYGLDDRVIGVRSPAGAEDFSSSLCVQTGSEAHPASCTMGIGGPFPGVKHGRGVMLTTHPHLVPRSRMSGSYTPLPPSVSMACRGTALLFTLLKVYKLNAMWIRRRSYRKCMGVILKRLQRECVLKYVKELTASEQNPVPCFFGRGMSHK
jgi:hypothetical protein